MSCLPAAVPRCTPSIQGVCSARLLHGPRVPGACVGRFDAPEAPVHADCSPRPSWTTYQRQRFRALGTDVKNGAAKTRSSDTSLTSRFSPISEKRASALLHAAQRTSMKSAADRTCDLSNIIFSAKRRCSITPNFCVSGAARHMHVCSTTWRGVEIRNEFTAAVPDS